MHVLCAAAPAAPLGEHDPAEVRDLDRDRRGEEGQELGVVHTWSLAKKRLRRMGPEAHSRPALVPGLPFRPVVEVAHSVPILEWDTPLFRQARTQLEQALAQAEIPEW